MRRLKNNQKFYYDYNTKLKCLTQKIETATGTACCAENGVPDHCFGYCSKERKAESRAITGICQNYIELIGKCSESK